MKRKLKTKFALLLVLFAISSCNDKGIPSAYLDLKTEKISLDAHHNYEYLNIWTKRENNSFEKKVLIKNNSIDLKNIFVSDSINFIPNIKDFELVQLGIYEKTLGTILHVQFKPDTLKQQIIVFKNIIE